MSAYEELIKSNEKDLNAVLENAGAKDPSTKKLLESDIKTRQILTEVKNFAENPAKLLESDAKSQLIMSDIKGMTADAKIVAQQVGEKTHGIFNKYAQTNLDMIDLTVKKDLKQDNVMLELKNNIKTLTKHNAEMMEIMKQQLEQNKQQSRELSEMRATQNRQEQREKETENV